MIHDEIIHMISVAFDADKFHCQSCTCAEGNLQNDDIRSISVLFLFGAFMCNPMVANDY